MLEETTIIKSKAIFSDDKEHRLLLRKKWNSEKPSAMVIMINPNTADTINFDMTTMLVLRQHRIIIAYKQKAPSPKAECVEKHSIFHRKGTLNQTVRDFVAARYRFANANIIFNFAVCFRRPRYRVFRYRKIFFMTAKTCSTLQRTDDF